MKRIKENNVNNVSPNIECHEIKNFKNTQINR